MMKTLIGIFVKYASIVEYSYIYYALSVGSNIKRVLGDNYKEENI